MVLLNHDCRAVVMVREGDEWDFPYFEYPESISGGDSVKVCCRDFSRWFGLSSKETCFTAVVELLGVLCVTSKRNPNRIGQGKLLLMDFQLDGCVDDLMLPVGAEWKDVSFLSGMLEKNDHQDLLRRVVRLVLGCMQPHGKTLASISDPRYRRGWFRNASEFLRSVICTEEEKIMSDVVQEHMSFTSTLLSATASERHYFLKSPTLGCNEGPITVRIGSIFPKISPVVIGISPELNCFVSEGFVHVVPELESVIRTLGHIQIESRLHLDLLKDAGVPVRSLEGLAKKIEMWASGNGITEPFQASMKYFGDVAPLLIDMCRRLAEFKVPLTLVHGDMALANATYRPADSMEVVLFDWEFACIGHPFCDFHRLNKDSSQEEIDQYLRMWCLFENIERAREAYGIGWKLGWLLKAWSLSDRIEECNPQVESSLEGWMCKILRDVRSLVSE